LNVVVAGSHYSEDTLAEFFLGDIAYPLAPLRR